MAPRSPHTARILAAATIALLARSLSTPTHVLGSTAVFGRAYLWGESSARVNHGTRVVWFVDRWELVQHFVFGGAVVAALVAMVCGRGVALLAVLLTGLLSLDLKRAIAVDGSGWGDVTSSHFGLVTLWTLALYAARVAATWRGGPLGYSGRANRWRGSAANASRR